VDDFVLVNATGDAGMSARVQAYTLECWIKPEGHRSPRRSSCGATDAVGVQLCDQRA
jgi:hypothetical protein